MMLTQTSELALKALLVIGLEGGEQPLTPKHLAARFECSASYLSKTLQLLVRAGILQSVRGAHGGVLLTRDPRAITLLDVVEACQGIITGDYCRTGESLAGEPCAFHKAMKEIHMVTLATLRKWTLQEMLELPALGSAQGCISTCKMAFEGCENYGIR